MGEVSCWRRHSADGDYTHALVAAQSHWFPDNLVALLGPIRAWNCSTKNARAAVGVLCYGAPADPSDGTRAAGSLICTQWKISGVFARTFLVAIELRLPGACSPSSSATVSVHPG